MVLLSEDIENELTSGDFFCNVNLIVMRLLVQ
jgi:hypothetical protein